MPNPYALLATIAAFIAIWWTSHRLQEAGASARAAALTCLGAVPIVFLGMKLPVVLAGAAQGEMSAALSLSSGNTYFAGLACGLIWFLLRARALHLTWRSALDAVVPAALISQVLGRIGCLLVGCCHGRPSAAPWAITYEASDAWVSAPVPFGVPLEPVQAYHSLFSAVVLVGLLVWERRNPRSGVVFGLFLVSTGLGRVVLDLFRADHLVTWAIAGHSISGSQVAGLGLALVGALLLQRRLATDSLTGGP